VANKKPFIFQIAGATNNASKLQNNSVKNEDIKHGVKFKSFKESAVKKNTGLAIFTNIKKN
jgi:hypothetical protein